MDYSQMICKACGAGDSWPLDKVRAELASIPGWELDESVPLIRQTFTFPDFKSAFAFAEKIRDIAETEGHHPDLHISWGKVIVELWTHAAGGISENDFIVAAKIDNLLP